LKKIACCLRHLVNSLIEGEFIGLGRLCEAAEFADELQRRRADFFVRCGRFEVVQGLNVSTHRIVLPPNTSGFVHQVIDSEDTLKEET
jgi:hypothetical protein